MMRVPMLVLPVVRPRVAAPGAGGTGGPGGVMTVPAVAAEAAVRLTLVQPAGSDLLAVPGTIVYRLRVLVLVVETVGGLRIGVRVLAADLRVDRRALLILEPVIVRAVLRGILVLVVRLAGPVLVASALAGVVMQRTQHRHALVRVLLDPEGLGGWHRGHEVG